ncbi:ngep-related [Anaeramoeba flamelloides]|uniref:Ngep-related n=1 Tax=Anaeramoeba flamelloides TaxID=1746091 RepID=A0ABQ8YQY9_9EUKA|nr:ngep-related [Anaeramoeba flamelloides]
MSTGVPLLDVSTDSDTPLKSGFDEKYIMTQEELDDPNTPHIYWEFSFFFNKKKWEKVKTTSNQKKLVKWLKDMLNAGLKINKTETKTGKVFYEIGATNELLDHWAEHNLNLNVKLKDQPRPDGKPEPMFDIYSIKYVKYEAKNVSQYRKNIYGSVFTPIDRQKIISRIMMGPKTEQCCEINFPRLAQQKIISGFWSTHDYEEFDSLIKKWSFSWKTTQPLDEVRDYFGERVAFYFAYLGYYTKWLILSSIVGFFLAIGNMSTTKNDNVFHTMWSIFIVFWITLFCEFWKRRENWLAYHFGTLNFWEDEDQRIEFEGTKRVSPITDEVELYFPPWRRRFRMIATYSVVFATMVCAAAISIGINKKKIIDNDRQKISTGENIWRGSLTGASIFVLNMLFQPIVEKLNDWENHETDSDYENALILKLFLFQIVNTFTSLFCISFINPEPEYLQSQLSALLITHQIINNFQEVGLPWIKAKVKNYLDKKKGKESISLIEKESSYTQYENTVDDYSEMMIQLGLVSLFAVGFKLAPICALVNNVIEIRSDSYKLKKMKKPPPKSACNIGTWGIILEIMSYLVILSNIALLGITYDDFSRDEDSKSDLSDTQRVWLILFIEHIIIVVKIIMHTIIPDVPAIVAIKIARDRHFENLKKSGKDTENSMKYVPKLLSSRKSSSENENVNENVNENNSTSSDTSSNSSSSSAFSHEKD